MKSIVQDTLWVTEFKYYSEEVHEWECSRPVVRVQDNGRSA